MKKLATITVSVLVGMTIGMTGLTGANAAGLGGTSLKFSQTQMYKCAGAVMEADVFINGGERTVAQKKQFNKKRDECAKVVGGF